MLSTYSDGTEKDAQTTLYKYISALEQAEVLKRCTRRLPEKQGKGSVQWYLTVNLGPQTPVWRQVAKAIYDPNSDCTYPTGNNTSLERKVIQYMRHEFEQAQEKLKYVLQIFNIDSNEYWNHASTIFSFLSVNVHMDQENIYANLFAMGQPKFGEEEVNWLKLTKSDLTPMQFRFTFGLWILAVISKLNEENNVQQLSLSSLIRVMTVLGFTSHKSLYKSWNHATSKSWKWRVKVLPEICDEARVRSAEIYFIESANIYYNDRFENTMLPNDESIGTETDGLNSDLGMILALSHKSNMHLKFTKGSLNAEGFQEFLIDILLGASNPIFLIAEYSEIFNSMLIKKFLRSESHRLKLFYTSTPN